jgi:hypothetical protein
LDWLKIEKAYNQQLPLLERDLLSKREITAQIEKIYPFCLEISKEEGKLYYDYEGNLVPLSDCPLATLEFVLQRGETTLRHIIAETLNEFRQVYRDKVVFNDKGTLSTYRNGERIEICASEDSLPVGGLGDLYQTLDKLKRDIDFAPQEFSAIPPSPQKSPPQLHKIEPHQPKPHRKRQSRKDGGYGD